MVSYIQFSTPPEARKNLWEVVPENVQSITPRRLLDSFLTQTSKQESAIKFQLELFKI